MTTRKPRPSRPTGCICVNCGDTVEGRANTRQRGPDTAWFGHCRPCADLVADQMQPLGLLPRPQRRPLPVPHLRKSPRLPHRLANPVYICLDERSAGLSLAAGARLLTRSPDETGLADQVRRFAGLADTDTIPTRAAAEFQAAIALGAELDRHRRDGWADLAGDVHGLPWYGERQAPFSHGTWGLHLAATRGNGSATAGVPSAHPSPMTGPSPRSATRRTCYIWCGIADC